MESYQIKKVLSNNVVLVTRDDEEMVLIGKGLGFGKKKDMKLENSENIEHIFVSVGGDKDESFSRIIGIVDPKIIEFVENLIKMASEEFGITFKPNVHLGLMDHLDYAVRRLKEGITIINPFLSEIKIMYESEFEIGRKAVESLSSYLEVEIPEAEIGFIALHLHSGRENKGKDMVLKETKAINACLLFLAKKLSISWEDHNFDKLRLVLHLKGIVERNRKKHKVKNPILENIKETLYEDYPMAYNLARMLSRDLELEISEDEVGFIALHILKLRNNGD